MSYQPPNFALHELVGPETYHSYLPHVLWRLVDHRLLRSIQALRDFFGPMVINNWRAGGNFSESGLRVPGDVYYSPTSLHSYFRAFDGKFSGVTAAEVREYLRPLTHAELVNRELDGITRIEDDVDWVHMDSANVLHDGIYFFKP